MAHPGAPVLMTQLFQLFKCLLVHRLYSELFFAKRGLVSQLHRCPSLRPADAAQKGCRRQERLPPTGAYRPSFQRICRSIPSRTGASCAIGFKRRTRRRAFSSVEAAVSGLT